MAVILWHNPRCSKSRAALGLLQDRGVDVDVRRYLDDAQSLAELQSLQKALGVPAIEMMRVKEPVFKEMNLTTDIPDEALLAAMAAEPKLIERPVIIRGAQAVIGRPPERALDLL
ncbi:MAG: arsenate reductase (glutaredoxin) [Paracoccaceae bacterium]|nr:arsenate reductase (glutaredoxin) [Paracoccaceae bacterium]